MSNPIPKILQKHGPVSPTDKKALKKAVSELGKKPPRGSSGKTGAGGKRSGK